MKVMKKNKIYIGFAVFAAMLSLASCAKEAINDAEQGNNGIVSEADGLCFRASYDAFDTRTNILDGGKVQWSNADAISIFDGEGAAGWAGGYTKDKRYQNTLSTGDVALFKAVDDANMASAGKSVYYAMCPRCTSASCDVENGIYDFWMLDCQTGIKGNFSQDRTVEGRHMNFSVAKTTDPHNDPLVFHNILAHLKITIPEYLSGKVTHIAVIPVGGEYLGGDTEVTLNDDGTTVVEPRYLWNSNGTGSKYSAMYLFPDFNADRYAISGKTFEAGTYYLAVRPAVLSQGLIIEYRTDASGKASETTGMNVIASQMTSNSIELKKGCVYNMGTIFGKPETAEAGKGISSLPYAFSFYTSSQTNDAGKYITKGSMAEKSYSIAEGLYGGGNTYKQYYGVAATDKDASLGVTWELSSCVYYKIGSTEKTADKQFNYWAQNQAHDNINTGDFNTRYSISYLPFECGWYLNVPLQTALPENFNVAFGMYYGGSWGLNNWALYYSNDKKSWLKAGTWTLDKVGDSGKNYMYYNCDIASVYNFKAGDVLHLKLVPIGKASLSSTGCDGFGTGNSVTGRIRFHSSITISPVEVAATPVPSETVLFEGFDGFKGGLDYFVGDRLAGMANYCGEKAGALGAYTLTNVYNRPGYAQIGYVDSQTMASDGDMTTTTLTGSIITPALGKAGDLELSFKACVYRSPAARDNVKPLEKIDGMTPDITSILVKVTGGGTIDGASELLIENVPTSAWQTITKTIVGATADTKVEFTSPEDGTFHRWFIDDICVK